MKPHDIFSLLGSIVLVAMVATVVLHGPASAGILKAFGGAFAYDLKAAEGR